MIKIALLLALAAPACAQTINPYQSVLVSTTTGRARENISGFVAVAKSSQTASTFTIVLDGVTGGINGSSVTASYGVKAATFTALAISTYSIQSSSGIYVGGTGGVIAAFFQGPLLGSFGDFSTTGDTMTVLTADTTAYYTGNGKAASVLKGGYSTTGAGATLFKAFPGEVWAHGRSVADPAVGDPYVEIISGHEEYGSPSTVSSPTHLKVKASGLTYDSNANITGSVTGGSFIGPLTGNATTATALAANGANCTAGTFPLGVDAAGAAESCSSSLTGSASLNVLKSGDSMSGALGLPTGSAASPSIFGGSSSNSGIYYSGTDMLLSANGVVRGSVVTGIGLCGGTGATTGQFCLRSSVGDKTDPTGQFAGDANTGFYRSAADDWRLVAGGADMVRLQSNQVNIMPFTQGTATFTATGSIATASSVTASAFFGDGSHLTGLIAGIQLSSGASTNGTLTNFPQQSAQNLLLSSASFDYSMNGSTAVISVKGLQVVASTEVYPNGTTTQTNWNSGAACIAGSTVTWTQGNNHGLFCLSATGNSGASNYHAVALLIDGAYADGYVNRAVQGVVANSNEDNLSFCYKTKTALSAGTHNACLAFKTSAGTLTVPAATGNGNTTAQFSFTELATGGQGYAAPASTEIVSGTAFTISNNTNWTTVTAMSSSITVTGQVAQVALNCGWARSGGSFVSTLSSRIVRDDSAEIIVLPDLGGNTASASTALTLPVAAIHLSTGLTAGQHSWTYQVKTTANTDTWTEQPSACRLNVHEIKNAPGTGNLSDNGTNSVTGTFDLGLARATNWTFYRQEVSSKTVDFFSKDTPGNTAIPHDDTQPLLSTEGMRVLTATMTAQVAASTVVVEGVVMGCEYSNLADYGAACIYSDANQTPLCCSPGRFLAEIEPLRISVGPCKTWPGDTASHVYTLKFGMNVANVAAVNGCTARQYGGALQTTLTVKEQAGPQ